MLDTIFEVRTGVLVAYYQGLFDANGGKRGAELLVRLKHPKQGIISPGFFLPQAELSGLIVAIDRWSFENAIAWQARHSNLQISCNISGKTLISSAFVNRLCDRQLLGKIDPAKINIELTESSNLTDFAVMQATKIADAGYRLVIDDLGREYSGFNRLAVLPVSKVKIDKFIIDRLIEIPAERTKAISIIKGIREIATRLKIEVCVEGVETQAQFKTLVDLGCDEYQGYFLHKPQPEKF